jgi:phosphoglycerate dehydrogenase-like enzyme
LEDLARSADILAVCASSDADNEGMISANVIEAVGPNGLLVNVGRGQLVDEDSLIEALKSDRLGAAALDVFASEPTSAMRWRDVPNVICTPHIAGATWESLGRMTAMCRSNLDAFFAGLPLPNPVLPVRN